MSEQLLPASFGLGSFTGGDRAFGKMLDALPAAVYRTDAAGRITYFNEAAARFWGERPAPGASEWRGSCQLFWPDGRPMPLGQGALALALRESQPSGGVELMAERPGGARLALLLFPTPLYGESGALVGSVNMAVEITERKRAEELLREQDQRLAAIVESSEDAIVAKDLDGVVRSWNRGAERLFGYAAEEMIGRSITIIIPADRLDEEATILSRIRRGERTEHYETIRRRKDGSLVEISLTVSPVKNAAGEVIGASKVARDITERRRSEEQQRLLLREMNHRIKNLFALCSGVVGLSARTAKTPEDFASVVQERLQALARAHMLTLSSAFDEHAQPEQPATLHALIKTMVSPYGGAAGGDGARVRVSGLDIPIAGGCVTSFALLLHEFATNAAKYGALSTPEGHIDIQCGADGDQFVLRWTERGGPCIERQTGDEGFGSLLARATVKRQLGGELSRDWEPEGLSIRLCVPRDRLEAAASG